MSRKHSNKQRIWLTLACLILLVSFVVARTLREATKPAQQNTNSTAAAAASPTPSPSLPSTRPIAPSTKMPRRDLTLYDKAAPLKIGKDISKAARNTVMAQVRSFLLDHWQQRRRGYLTMSSRNTAGHNVGSTFFIEPDAEGRWSIVLENGSGASEVFRVAEQIELPADDAPPAIGPLRKQKPRSTGIMGLHLKESATANSGLVL